MMRERELPTSRRALPQGWLRVALSAKSRGVEEGPSHLTEPDDPISSHPAQREQPCKQQQEEENRRRNLRSLVSKGARRVRDAPGPSGGRGEPTGSAIHRTLSISRLKGPAWLRGVKQCQPRRSNHARQLPDSIQACTAQMFSEKRKLSMPKVLGARRSAAPAPDFVLDPAPFSIKRG